METAGDSTQVPLVTEENAHEKSTEIEKSAATEATMDNGSASAGNEKPLVKEDSPSTSNKNMNGLSNDNSIADSATCDGDKSMQHDMQQDHEGFLASDDKN